MTSLLVFQFALFLIGIMATREDQTAELVKDFKCFLNKGKLNCSWIPVNPSLNLTVHYGQCEPKNDLLTIKSVKTCDKPRKTENPERHQCIMTCNETEDWTCISVEANTTNRPFKAPLAIEPPLLNVTLFDNMLKLTITPPLQKPNCMTFEVCHSRCNVQEKCHTTAKGVDTIDFDYVKACRYEFQAKTNFLKSCLNPALVSEMSATISYGINANPYRTLTIAAASMSIILSVCIILLCYCLRKHKEIFWPSIPDPSVIFKQMSENNDLLTPGGNLYTPVPEPIDACKIRLISENYINQYTS